MKKIFVVLFITILVSSCSTDINFTQDSANIDSMDHIERVLRNMMEESGHDEDTEIPYNLAGVVLLYSSGQLVIDSIGYNVPTGSSSKSNKFENTSCSRTNGYLECRTTKSEEELDDLNETITLEEFISNVSNINIDELFEYVSEENEIYSLHKVSIGIFFELFDNELINLESLEDVYIYSDDTYLSEGSFLLDGIYTYLNIYIEIDNETYYFKIHYND